MNDSLSSRSISIISHNMHGVNQSINCLDTMCSTKTDLICLQETWLNVDSMLRIFDCFSSDYYIFCSSAMDEKQKSEILKGRPFGGMCVLFNKLFYNVFSKVDCLRSEPNYIIIKADDLLIVNIYLPSARSFVDYENVDILLDEIADTCAS